MVVVDCTRRGTVGHGQLVAPDGAEAEACHSGMNHRSSHGGSRPAHLPVNNQREPPHARDHRRAARRLTRSKHPARPSWKPSGEHRIKGRCGLEAGHWRRHRSMQQARARGPEGQRPEWITQKPSLREVRPSRPARAEETHSSLGWCHCPANHVAPPPALHALDDDAWGQHALTTHRRHGATNLFFLSWSHAILR